jgi:Tol biopolymer transport system component
MFQPVEEKYQFGEFQLDTAERVLRQSGEIVALTPKAAQALELLVRNRGRVIPRSEMIEALWPDSFVEESNLTVTISLLRKALGEGENETLFIETLPKRGYRFVPEVENGKSDSASRDHFSAMQITRLTHDGHVLDVGISADARLLAYVSIQAGKHSLWIWNLESGEKWQLCPPDQALCWGLRFTHDGENLFYITTQPNSTISVLYRIPVTGGRAQKLIVNIDAPIALSPDGEQIVFIRRYPGQHKDVLIVAGVDGSGECVIASCQPPNRFSFSGPSWSPDGKLIAIGVSRKNEMEFSVVGVPPSGGPQIALSQWQWKDVRAVAWNEAGNRLYFSGKALNSNSLQIWRLSYPGGEAQRITNDPNNYEEISMAEKSQTLVTMQTDALAKVWIGPAGGAPRRLTTGRTDGFDGLAAAAGRVVYSSTEHQLSDLWSVNADGSDCQRLTSDSGFLPSVSRDGRMVAYVSAQGGTFHIWRMDANGENKKQLTGGEGGSYPSISPDGKWIVYTPLGSGRNTLWKISTDRGQSVQLTHNSLALKPVVSPDGKQIACIYRAEESDKWKIAVLSGEGGTPETAFALPYPYNQVIRWTPDGKALTYLDRSDGVYNIWRQPLDGATPTQITTFTEDVIFYYDWLGDETQLIFSRGEKTRHIVLIKSFA